MKKRQIHQVKVDSNGYIESVAKSTTKLEGYTVISKKLYQTIITNLNSNRKLKLKSKKEIEIEEKTPDKTEVLLSMVQEFVNQNFQFNDILFISFEEIADLLPTNKRVDINNTVDNILSLKFPESYCNKNTYKPCNLYLLIRLIKKLTAKIIIGEITDINTVKQILSEAKSLVPKGGAHEN